MNVFQQQAFAKAIGMSREQLADSLAQQAALTKLGIDQGKNVDSQLRSKIKAALAIKDEAQREKELAKIREVSGADEIIRQQENKSLGEAQALAMKRLAETMGTLGDLLSGPTKLMEKFSRFAGSSFEFLAKLSVKLRPIKTAFKPAVNFAQSLGDNIAKASASVSKFFGGLSTGAKIAGKGGMKAVLKKIPILGALVGAGLAFQRAKNGDWLGAGMEFVSGIASIIPGYGTAASLAIDAALLGTDLAGVTGQGKNADRTATEAEGNVKINANDFILSTHPKDTILAAGGTKLGGNVEALLEKMVGLMEQGGHVYLDGSNVGDVLMLNSRLRN